MKIGILGTSNSILSNGWAPVFSAIAAPDTVLHFSAGANSSAYGLYALDHFDLLRRVDCLILDFTVNDQNFYDFSSLDLGRIESYWYELVRRVSQSGVVALNLMFFNQRHLGAASFPVRDVQRAICAHFGVPVIDMFDIVPRLEPPLGASFFQEPTHLSPRYSKPIAILVKKSLEQLMSGRAGAACRDSGASSGNPYQGMALAQAQSDAEKVVRGTSLVSYECVHVPEKGISCRVGQADVDGVFFRVSRDNTWLGLESNGRRINKVLSLSLGSGFYLRSVQPNLPVDGELRLTPARLEGAATSRSDQNQRVPPGSSSPGCDLVGLLLRNRVRQEVAYARGAEPEVLDPGCYFEALRHLGGLTAANLGELDSPGLLYLAATETPRPGMAIAAVKAAIALEDRNPHYWALFGDLLAKKGNLQSAEKAYQRAIGIDPDIPGFHAKLSHLLVQRGEPGQALAKAADALARQGGNPHFHYHHGVLLALEGRWEEAEAAQRTALELNPEWEAPRAHLGQIRAWREGCGDPPGIRPPRS